MLASIMSYETPKVVTVHNPSIGLLRQCRQQSETHCIFLWGTCWCESLMWICNNGWRFLSNGTDRERDRHMVSIITNLQCLTSRCSSISIQPMIVIIVPTADCVLAGGCCRCWWCCTWLSTSSGTRRKASPPSTFSLMSKVHSAIKVSYHP